MKTKKEIQAQIAKLQDELNEQETKGAAPWPREIKFYLFSSKEYAYETGVETGLEGEAAETFCYCCDEIGLTLQVYENGHAFITHLGKSTVTPPVKVAGR